MAALSREQELAQVYASLGKTVVDLAQADDELEREISVRRRAEMALREREATLESMLDLQERSTPIACECDQMA